MPTSETLTILPQGNGFLRDKGPMVSVVIPAYQCARYLTHAVESVLHQSYPDYEIIVINDGSPDTVELEAQLQPYWGRLRYLRQANRGPAAARNRGISEARGKFIAFLDSDDYWTPDHLAKQLGMFEQDPRLELVYSDWILVRNEKPWRRAFVMEPQTPEVSCDSLLRERSNVGTSTVLVSRAALLRCGGFDERLTRCEDFDLWVRLAFSGARMAFHPDPQVFYRCNSSGLSADQPSMTRARILVYQKIADTLPLTPTQRQIINRQLAANEAQFHIYEMKTAIRLRSYRVAVASGTRAQALGRRWKLSLALFGLKIAPGLFRQLHLAHSWYLARRNHPSDIEAQVGSAGSGNVQHAMGDVASEKEPSTTVV
jgi:glycosyltransferase involved in cell wall biosynthesis